MAKRFSHIDVPHDRNSVRAMRREITQQSEELHKTFWTQFKEIQSQSRLLLIKTREERVKLDTLVRAAEAENKEQVNALMHSISAHGLAVDNMALPTLSELQPTELPDVVTLIREHRQRKLAEKQAESAAEPAAVQPCQSDTSVDTLKQLRSELSIGTVKSFNSDTSTDTLKQQRKNRKTVTLKTPPTQLPPTKRAARDRRLAEQALHNGTGVLFNGRSISTLKLASQTKK